MQNPEIWNMLSKHLAAEETPKETEKFLKWFNQTEKNKELFYKVKNVWEGQESAHEPYKQNVPLPFRGRFTKHKIKDFILNQALGNLIGFTVGMWVTASFTHHVLERRSLKNLFGLAGRKRIVVNEIPEWQQSVIAILLGFIALELINYFFQTKKYLVVWKYFKKLFAIKN